MTTEYGSTFVGARAGFGQRFAASLIDGLIVGVIGIVLTLALHASGDALSVLVSIAYFVYFEGGPQGAGPGERVMKIRVCDLQTGGPIGYGRSFLRWIGRILCAIPLFLGYFWMLWDGQKQCWDDKLARDVVVPASF